MRDVPSAVPAHAAEGHAADEGGDEARSADRLGEPECQERSRDGYDLEPGVVDQPACGAVHHDGGRDGSGENPDEDAVPDLLEDELDGVAVPDRALLCEGDGERDQEERYADAVVEAGLDVQALTDPHRQPLRRDDGLAESRVGGREDDGHEERLGPRQVREHEERDDEAGEDRQRQPDPEQPRRDVQRRVAAP